MRLHQHLANPCHATEIAINLKRRMRIEKIRQRGLGQQRLNVLPRLVAIAQPRPEIDDPRATPARVSAPSRDPTFNRLARRRRKFRRAASCDLPSRMLREHMRAAVLIVLLMIEPR